MCHKQACHIRKVSGSCPVQRCGTVPLWSVGISSSVKKHLRDGLLIAACGIVQGRPARLGNRVNVSAAINQTSCPPSVSEVRRHMQGDDDPCFGKAFHNRSPVCPHRNYCGRPSELIDRVKATPMENQLSRNLDMSCKGGQMKGSEALWVAPVHGGTPRKGPLHPLEIPCFGR